jgi:TRAP-type C4-dicarboxylate transport system permease small subunit
MKHHVSGVLKAIDKLEDWFLISILATMVLLAVTQIFYRNIFGAGVVWIDPLLRVLVLWVAIAGAVVATRTDNHIRIDFFTKYFSKKVCKYMLRFEYVFCVFICGLISWHAVKFVQMDYKFETIAFANVPAWITELIIPVGFFLMAFRYVLLFISPPEQEKR